MTFFSNLKMTGRFMIAAVIIAIIPLIIEYLTFMSKAEETMIENIRMDLTEKAYIVSHSSDRLMQQWISNASVLSQADVFESDNTQKISQYLDEIVKESNYLEDVDVFDLSGRVIATAGNQRELGQLFLYLNPGMEPLVNSTLLAKQGDTYVSELMEFDFGHGLMILTPITDDSNEVVVKVLALKINLKSLEEIISEFDERVIGDKYVYIVDNDGRIILSDDPSTKPLDPFPDLQVRPDLLEKFETPGEVGSIIYEDVTQTEVMAGFADMAEFGQNKALDWSLIAIAPTAEITKPLDELRTFLNFTTLIIIIIVCIITAIASKTITRPIQLAAEMATDISEGKLNTKLQFSQGNDEIGQLGIALEKMLHSLRENQNSSDLNNWHKEGQMKLAEHMRGNKIMNTLCREILEFLAEYLDIKVGMFYTLNEQGSYSLSATFAVKENDTTIKTVSPGEGLAGEAILTQKKLSLSKIPEDYIAIKSTLGMTKPKELLAIPLIFEEEVIAFLELGTLEPLSQQNHDFIDSIANSIAITIKTVADSEKTTSLLIENQKKTEELQASEEELQAQQEELRASNEELEDKNLSLQRQKVEIEEQNINLEQKSIEISQKAEELERSTKYKSEFLANMSHEIRTPLNSLLVLSRNLMHNRDNNLNAKQLSDLDIIHNSGNNLLNLLNEILDISKIEAGKMDIHMEDYPVDDLLCNLKDMFQHLADEKNISLNLKKEANVPEVIRTDGTKLTQIIRNLISNAIKFTSEGSVSLKVKYPLTETLKKHSLEAKDYLEFSVTDTGIGVPADKQDSIFEAFHQADGSTTRKYGGTGLGLTISRDFSKMLDGHIILDSGTDKGSTFSVLIPVDKNTQTKSTTTTHIDAINDDTAPAVLIIQSDDSYNKELTKLCNEKKMQSFIATTGSEGLSVAKKNKLAAIFLDVGLPQINGMQILDHLKENEHTRQIPVFLISSGNKPEGISQRGAVGFLRKPFKEGQVDFLIDKLSEKLSKKIEDILIIEDDECYAEILQESFHKIGLVAATSTSAEDSLQTLAAKQFDCIIVDLNLPGMSGFEFLNELENCQLQNKPAIIIHTAKELSRQEINTLEEHADSIIAKGNGFIERLLDEASLFLYKLQNNNQPKTVIATLNDEDLKLKGKKVLVVDDDIRNIYSLIATLEPLEMEFVKAGNGQMALDLLKDHEDLDMIIMDIMMPGLDGFEVIEKIRQKKAFINTPILVLSAKAMPEDKNRSLEVGANDYMTKPVDIHRLTSLMRVWLN